MGLAHRPVPGPFFRAAADDNPEKARDFVANMVHFCNQQREPSTGNLLCGAEKHSQKGKRVRNSSRKSNSKCKQLFFNQ